MFFKLSCGCIVLIIKEKYENDILVKVVARTLLRCSGEVNEEIYFGSPTTYQPRYNKHDKSLPSDHDVWDKIQKGHLLSEDEQETIYHRMNQLFFEGNKWRDFCRNVQQTLRSQ